MSVNFGDPIYEHYTGSWWFYDETWTHLEGPFKWELQARKWFAIYTKELNDGPRSWTTRTKYW